jgi:cholesterol transport system auxiliary component
MKQPNPALHYRSLAACAMALLAAACSVLKPATTPYPQLHALVVPEANVRRAAGVAASGAYTIAVSPPQAAAGLDSRHMMYLRSTGQPQFYAYNEWIDTPARMLAPLLLVALDRSGVFRAVVATPSNAVADLRLETQILSLQQEFLQVPSRTRFAVHVELIASDGGRIIGARDFESVMEAASEDATGGANAASRAVADVVGQVTAFCAQVTATRAGQQRAYQ